MAKSRLTCHGPSTFLDRTTAPSRWLSTSHASSLLCLRHWTASNTKAPRAIGMGYHFVSVDHARETLPGVLVDRKGE
jgi:hypothetical protein